MVAVLATLNGLANLAYADSVDFPVYEVKAAVT
ncbi:MAG: hypothetical protein ACI80V_000132 [Rhodothermales bacterium]|jgi:hypothetical protein